MPTDKWENPIRVCLQRITELDGRALVAYIIGGTILTIFWGLSLGGLTLPAMCIIFVLLGKRLWKAETPHEASLSCDEDGVVEPEERKKDDWRSVGIRCLRIIHGFVFLIVILLCVFAPYLTYSLVFALLEEIHLAILPLLEAIFGPRH